jgi:hypothetical protein
MAYDNLAAEVIGGILSGLRFVKQGWLVVVQVAVTGAMLAHFVGADVARLVLQYSGIAISYGAALFLTAYFGPDVLEKGNMFIKAFRVSRLWNHRK